ncbi:hypothetical protein BDB00DRAFT_876283 [Zychaea mexicana]|uniref:uncharacterized protein n=1 Tax=Zychaea mexicana TaxID=64656 RepID=UPI0022FF0572|nr:uncharacterized protein BDB00DRAFT_876283 [Zychaea mexicana]KAI9489519.1 hypothetical protein BDB00DRAFT_876283 [Zychaea mexicana]
MPETPSGNNSDNPTPLLDPRLSWAQVAQKKRVSLLHNSYSVSQDTSRQQQTVIYSHVWRVGRSPNAVFFDHHTEGPRVILEVYFQQPDDYRRALEQGLEFPKQTFIHGTPGLYPTTQIKKICLTRLPFLSPEALVQGLQTTMAMYGRVMDVGVYRDQTTNLFMGNGFAVIDQQLLEREQAFTTLDHHIPWCGDENNLVYGTFSEMKPHCSRCHSASHVVRKQPGTRRKTNPQSENEQSDAPPATPPARAPPASDVSTPSLEPDVSNGIQEPNPGTSDADVLMDTSMELEASMDEALSELLDDTTRSKLLHREWFRKLPMSEDAMLIFEQSEVSADEEKLLATLLLSKLTQMAQSDSCAADHLLTIERSGYIRFQSVHARTETTEAGL